NCNEGTTDIIASGSPRVIEKYSSNRHGVSRRPVAQLAGQRQADARIDSIFERRPLIGSELVFVRCSFPFSVTAPRYCSPSTPVDKAGPQIAVSSISRARVGYGIAPTLDNEPCDAKWACIKSQTAAR